MFQDGSDETAVVQQFQFAFFALVFLASVLGVTFTIGDMKPVVVESKTAFICCRGPIWVFRGTLGSIEAHVHVLRVHESKCDRQGFG